MRRVLPCKSPDKTVIGWHLFALLTILVIGHLWMPSGVGAANVTISVDSYYFGPADVGLRIKHVAQRSYTDEKLQPYTVTISRYKDSEGSSSQQTLASYNFSPTMPGEADPPLLQFFDENAGTLEKGALYVYSIRQVIPYYDSLNNYRTHDRTTSRSFTPGSIGGTVFRDTVWTGSGNTWSNLTVAEGVTLTLASGFTLNITSSAYSWEIYGKLVAQGALFNDAYGTTFKINAHETSSGLVFEGNTTGGETRDFQIHTYGMTTPAVISGNNFLMGGSIFHKSQGNLTVENNQMDYIAVEIPQGKQSGLIQIKNNTLRSSVWQGQISLTGLAGAQAAAVENNLFGSNQNQGILIKNAGIEGQPGLSIQGNQNVKCIAMDHVYGAFVHGNKINGAGGYSVGVKAGIQIAAGSRNVVSGNVLTGSNVYRPYSEAGIGIGFAQGDENYAAGGPEVTDNTITGNRIKSYGTGLMLGSAANNVISRNTIELSRIAIHLGPFVDDTYSPATTYGTSYPQGNTIADNKIVKDTQLPSTARMVRIQVSPLSPGDCVNTWNTAKKAGANVAGGPYLGGNYWSDYSGADTDGDRLGDTPYKIHDQILDSDHLPLIMKPALSLGVGNLNPTAMTEFYGLEGEFDYANGRKNIVANHLTLTANEMDAWNVTGLTFHTSGTGKELEDIAAARLYLGTIGGTLLGTKTFDADNGDVSFVFAAPVNIPKSGSAAMILVYDIKPERAFPCNSYKTKIDMGDVNAAPAMYSSGMKLPAPPAGPVEGYLSVKQGNLVKSEGDRQYGEAADPAKNKPLATPLKVRIQWQHPATIDHVTYEIASPAAYAGYLGTVPDKLQSNQPLNAEGYAEEQMTLGTKKGPTSPYLVQVFPAQKGAACGSSWTPPVFTAWGLGLDLATASQYDNPNNDKEFGTFLSGIAAENKFTLNIAMTPNYAEVDEVFFNLGGQVVKGTVVKKNEVYEAIFDMAAFQKHETLTVTVKMTKDGAQVEQQAEYRVKSLKIPAWVGTVTSISESITKEFSGNDGGAYNFTFNYPTNFIWSDYVPGNVGLLGGLKNDIDIEFSAGATYRVDETSVFGATVKGQPTILGQEFGLEGGLSGEFDPNFAFLRGAGKIRANYAFDLPSVGYSYTVNIYIVPVTAAVDLSGNVEIFVGGSAVLNRRLEFEEVTISPGTTVTGNVAISLAAVFGLAKIAATGSPTATVEIELKYTTGSGTTTTWRGEVVVPITVVGSIFWGLGSSELGSATLGPWTFPAASGAAAPLAFRPLGEVKGPPAPRLISTSSLAADGTGKRMSVWIGDTRPNESSANPDVFFRYFNGSAWGEAAPIIGANSPNSEWETDPAVVFMGEHSGQKTALSCWTANKGDKSLAHLNDILASQDIACSAWNGTAWSEPARIIDDAEADGTVSLTYDPTLNKSLAVWVHNADPGKTAMNRTAWKLMYGIYDPAANQGTGGFTTAQDVTGTNTGKADQMPAVATDGTGNAYLAWARDDDGVFYTELDKVTNGTNVNAKNLDSHIMWSKLGETGWTAPAALATGGEATRLSPSLAPAPGGSFLAVWEEKAPGKMRSIRYAVLSGGVWSTPGLVAESGQFMEDPKAVVDAAGKATVIWRGYAKGGKGALFSSTGSMAAQIAWSDPQQITHDDTIQWQPTAVLDQNNKVVTSWSGYNMATGQAQSGTGMTGGVNVASSDPGTATLTNTYSAQASDANSDQVYESLQLSVGVNVVAAGSFKVQADLYAGDKFVAQAALTRVDLTSGAQTFVLVFPGGLISNRGLDGPYSLKNVVVMDIRDSAVQTAYAKAPTFTTAVYQSSSFIPGPLTLNQQSYQGTLVRATITVRDAQANLSASAKDQILVKVSSTRNAKGFAVILEETGVNTGIFTGTVGFSTKADDLTNKNILVADHDLLYIVYDDVQGYKWTETASWRQMSAGLGDLNSDGLIDLKDAILAIQFMAGMNPDASINPLGMIDDKGKITVREVIYILQKTAALR